MKIKKEFVMRRIDDECLLVPVGETASSFNGIITLNEVGAFVWEQLSKCEDETELLHRILAEYEVDETTAAQDLHELLQSFRDAELIA